jgi:hypothetical protein
MNRKLKNTLALVGVWILLSAIGFGYILLFQKININRKNKELTNLKSVIYNPQVLKTELDDKMKKANTLDSVLASRKFNIPKDLSSLKFYDFVNALTPKLSQDAKVNIEFVGTKPDREFLFHQYKLTGSGNFNDIYQIIYAIEESKELKKIKNLNLSNFVTAQEGKPSKFLVNFTFTAAVYFAHDDRFAVKDYVENNLNTRTLYDAFYPLIRTEIPPNTEGLLDVQGARLLALVPEGAFLSDNRGNSFLLAEGDEVYLGYLTKIDYKGNKVKFILNKGGIVESIELELEKEIKSKE